MTYLKPNQKPPTKLDGEDIETAFPNYADVKPETPKDKPKDDQPKQ